MMSVRTTVIYIACVTLLQEIMCTGTTCYTSQDDIRIIHGRRSPTNPLIRQGVIHSPNFPKPFKTPINMIWLIDATSLNYGDDYTANIDIYLNQMYLIQGISFQELRGNPFACHDMLEPGESISTSENHYSVSNNKSMSSVSNGGNQSKRVSRRGEAGRKKEDNEKSYHNVRKRRYDKKSIRRSEGSRMRKSDTCFEVDSVTYNSNILALRFPHVKPSKSQWYTKLNVTNVDEANISYVEVRLQLNDLYTTDKFETTHIRTKSSVTHNVFGFNITYQIYPVLKRVNHQPGGDQTVDKISPNRRGREGDDDLRARGKGGRQEKEETSLKRRKEKQQELRSLQLGVPNQPLCTFRKCSYLGNCYASYDLSEFYCVCAKPYFGKYCQYGPGCDPTRNITFCQNGGKCRLSAGIGRCDCKGTGFNGGRCEIEEDFNRTECPGPKCDQVCKWNEEKSQPESKKPCSCHLGRASKKGWLKYIGVLQFETPKLYPWNSTYGNNVNHYSTKSSAFYQTEQKHFDRIRKELTSQLKGRCGDETMDEVSIITVRPRSEVVFQFYGDPSIANDTFEVLSGLMSKGELVPGYKFGSTFTFDKQPPLNLLKVTINKKGPLRIGKDFILTCVAVGSPSITFRWFKDDVPINSSLAIRHIYLDPLEKDGKDQSTSIITFDKATPFDSGKFTCQVSDSGEEQCRSIYVRVHKKPEIEVLPLSLTLKTNESAIITCTDASTSLITQKFGFVWYKDDKELSVKEAGNEVVTEDIFPNGQILRIVKATRSAVYSCRANTSGGESNKHVVVNVLESHHAPSCPNEVERVGNSSMYWKWTAGNETAMLPCPKFYIGYAQRACDIESGRPRWKETDYSKCLSNRLKAIKTMLENLKAGFGVSDEPLKLMPRLFSYVAEQAPLLRGEGEKFLKILSKVSEYSDSLKQVEHDFPHFVQIASKLLSLPENCIFQKSALDFSKLISFMSEKYSLAVTRSKPLIFTEENLVIEYRMNVNVHYEEMSYKVPRNHTAYPLWFEDTKIQIPPYRFSQTYSGETTKVEPNMSPSLIIIAIKNLTSMISKESIKFLRHGDILITPVSPLINIKTPQEYFFSAGKKLRLEFTVSKHIMERAKIDLKYNLSCAALEENPSNGFQWSSNFCVTNFTNTSVICTCDRFGQFNIISKESSQEDNVLLPEVQHWCILAGSIFCVMAYTTTILCICIHTQFRFSANSLYTLKILDCVCLIIATLLILSLKGDLSSVQWTTCLYSFFIATFSSQLTKCLDVFFLTSQRNQLFPWIQSVSLVTFLGAVILSTVLPLWTVASISSFHRSQRVNYHYSLEKKYVSILVDDEYIFSTLIFIFTATVIIFLSLYYFAVTNIKKCQQQPKETSKNEENMEPSIIRYRLKTLNRSLILLISILSTLIATTLYGSFHHETSYQYLYGISASITGLLVLVLYTVKGEYPLPKVILGLIYKNSRHSDDNLLCDPEIVGKRMINRCVGRIPSKSLWSQKEDLVCPRDSSVNNVHAEEGCNNDEGAQMGSSEAETTIDTFIGSSSVQTSNSFNMISITPSNINDCINHSNPTSGIMNYPSFSGCSSSSTSSGQVGQRVKNKMMGESLGYNRNVPKSRVNFGEKNGFVPNASIKTISSEQLKLQEVTTGAGGVGRSWMIMPSLAKSAQANYIVSNESNSTTNICKPKRETCRLLPEDRAIEYVLPNERNGGPSTSISSGFLPHGPTGGSKLSKTFSFEDKTGSNRDRCNIEKSLLTKSVGFKNKNINSNSIHNGDSNNKQEGCDDDPLLSTNYSSEDPMECRKPLIYRKKSTNHSSIALLPSRVKSPTHETKLIKRSESRDERFEGEEDGDSDYVPPSKPLHPRHSTFNNKVIPSSNIQSSKLSS